MTTPTSSLMSFRTSSKNTARASRRGFTLVEILVVIAIIGLLVGVVLTNITGSLDDANESTAKIFVNSSIKTPLTQYRIHMGTYPSTEEGLQALIVDPGTKAGRWKGPYLESAKLPVDPWKRPYQYRYPGTKNPRGYDVFSMGPDGQPDTADDIGNWEE
ncbi:general secretion pathway protein G [Opitutaceae bacterium TAV1]|nr:general secretion pathway protein G [Opitutaceae bacterium TAV1]